MWQSVYPEPLPQTQFGEWTILEDYRTTNKHIKDKIQAQCSCGVIKHVRIMNMLNGRSKSCGHAKYKTMRDISRQSPKCYRNRIGESFRGFTLTDYATNDEKEHLFTLTCPNGHPHTFKSTRRPKELTQTKGLTCWCMIENPVVQLRKKHGLTLKDVGDRIGVSNERVRQYENICLYDGKRLRKAYNDKDRTKILYYRDRIKTSTAFNQLVNAYDLSTSEANNWLKHISHKA